MENLTQSHIAHLAVVLRERNLLLRGQIRDELLNTSDASHSELAGSVADSGDKSVAAVLIDSNAARIGRQIREIRDIEAAQKRLIDGSFGICIDCADQIGYQRLTVYPVAKRCIACQGKYKKTQAHEGTPTL